MDLPSSDTHTLYNMKNIFACSLSTALAVTTSLCLMSCNSSSNSNSNADKTAPDPDKPVVVSIAPKSLKTGDILKFISQTETEQIFTATSLLVATMEPNPNGTNPLFTYTPTGNNNATLVLKFTQNPNDAANTIRSYFYTLYFEKKSDTSKEVTGIFTAIDNAYPNATPTQSRGVFTYTPAQP